MGLNNQGLRQMIEGSADWCDQEGPVEVSNWVYRAYLYVPDTMQEELIDLVQEYLDLMSEQ
jgi:hypothetical protein